MKLLTSILSLLVLITSCSKKNDDNSMVNNSDLVSGSWKVSLMDDKGAIKTSNYTGYSFTFASGTQVTAVNGSTTQTGTYSLIKDSGKTKLVMVFTSSSSAFEDISEDWEVISLTNSTIQLKNVSGSDGKVSLLTFVR